jgi:leucyl aminopeptidase
VTASTTPRASGRATTSVRPRVETTAGEPSGQLLGSAGTAAVIAIRSGPSGGVRAARGSAALARALGVDVPLVARRERAGTSAGDLTRAPQEPSAADARPGQVFLLGVGDGSPAALRSAAAVLTRSVKGADLVVTTLASGAPPAAVEAVVEGLVLGAYRVARTGRKAQSADAAVARVQLAGVDEPDAVRRALLLAQATVLARELANTRSNVKGPAWLATRATRAASAAGLDARVWSEAELRTDGFDAILAVGSGADRGPRLVQLEHRPSGRLAAGRPHVVLVGKGITFDTGGISLKPREAMLGMTTDMTGAAVVLAVLAACRELGVQARVTGLLPLAENAFGGGSYRPADVVRTYDGTTVEVRNTDAEGRMVLADAMGYARTRLRPDVMVDIATLTGAATQALGRTHAAVYATDDRLSAALVRAGEASGERLWSMPLVEDYRELIDSDVADICQISTNRELGAGSVMAALFLREFAGDVPWAHLDIAGPGRSERDRAEVNRGGTGFGARLLLRWLQTL